MDIAGLRVLREIAGNVESEFIYITVMRRKEGRLGLWREFGRFCFNIANLTLPFHCALA